MPDAIPRMNVEHTHVSLQWLVRLRWILVAGQVLAVAVTSSALGASLGHGRVWLCISVTVATNAILYAYLRTGKIVPRSLCGLVLVLDTVVLTVLLHASGGPSNPFSVLYLVHITLAALLFGSAWTWGITSLSIVAFGTLFVSEEHAHHMGHDFAAHLRGMWLAFTLTALLTATFVSRLMEAIRRRDHEIETIREHAARTEKLASLTTLAAGAAHELGSPLATIAVAAGELEHAVSRMPDEQAASIRADARLIRTQLERCRRIIDQMTAAAGEVTGEAPEPVAVAELLETVRADLPDYDAVRLHVDVGTSGAALVPHRALARAVASLIRNALDASTADGTVDVTIGTDADRTLRVTVSDRGGGMAPDVLAKATEPFFTTKPPGQGMGMGLFLARALVEQLGGRLLLVSNPGAGTSATLELPSRMIRATGSEHAV
jgi:two-component system sensor histidine kinase RegB